MLVERNDDVMPADVVNVSSLVLQGTKNYKLFFLLFTLKHNNLRKII